MSDGAPVRRLIPPESGNRMVEQEAFKDATDRAVEALGVSLARIAEAFGVKPPTLSQWRVVGSRFNPPPGWRRRLAAAVRELSAERRRQAAAGDRLVSEVDPDGTEEGTRRGG